MSVLPTAAVNLSVSYGGGVDGEDDNATITLSGPAGLWFGVGLDARSMADQPYALIVDGHGRVSERRLANHGPGVQLPPSARIVSSVSSGGRRTVVLSRGVAGASPQHASLPTTAGALNIIAAVGSTPQLSYHKAHTVGAIVLLPTAASACVCEPSVSTALVYMNQVAAPSSTRV